MLTGISTPYFHIQFIGGLGGLVVSALDSQAGYRGFVSRSGRDNFQTITCSTPSSYSTCPGLTGRRLVTDSGTKCAWEIHGRKVVQIHVHNSRHCLHVPRVPGSVKNPHNNIQFISCVFFSQYKEGEGNIRKLGRFLNP